MNAYDHQSKEVTRSLYKFVMNNCRMIILKQFITKNIIKFEYFICITVKKIRFLYKY